MLNFADKVLHKIGKEKGKDTIFINIGAMDGIMFDESAGYVSMYQYLPLYVEPIPYLFERLKSNITDPRARFENAAISDYDGIVQMITIDQTAIDSNLVHSCFYGMSSIYPPKNGLSSEGDKLVVEKHGRFQIVPCMKLSTLFTKYNIENFDIMSIDTEGHDWKILKQLDLTKYTPSLIRAEYINLSDTEKEEICAFFSKNNYIFEISGQNIDAIPYSLYQTLFDNVPANVTQLQLTPTESDKRVTIVTGLWNFQRDQLSDNFKRGYDEYKQRFSELLKTPSQMFIYISREDEDFIWQHRSKENTFIKIMESSEFETFFEFYDAVQRIRNQPEWYNQVGWLTDSPQAKLKYYNPMVMSKMFLLNNATLFNPFESEYFYWIDAGITNTVHPGYFVHDRVFDNLPTYSDAVDAFTFISYPYTGGEEIHGFPRTEMNKYCNTNYVNYVCRGGFFGGNKKYVNEVNTIYYGVLKTTLSKGLMGTEESIFTIIAHNYPEIVDRFPIEENGLIWPFFEKLKNVEVMLTELPPKPLTPKTAKVNLYVLGFNSPKQFESIVNSIKNADPGMFEQTRKILINNSTDESLFGEYDSMCATYGFEEIHRENLGVCGGRQYAAEHFAESNADFYMFFEDDMHLNGIDVLDQRCKTGFVKYVPELYNTILKIMIKSKLDFLKLSFSEFYGDNSVQWSWYNVPQAIRTKIWPTHDKLPEFGLDPNAPKTQFNNIFIMDNTPYITGEVYYSNWPQIVSKDGNKKMFLDTKWEHPYEQTWMSHFYQLTTEGKLTAAVLLASPVNHKRFQFYESNLRKES